MASRLVPTFYDSDKDKKQMSFEGVVMTGGNFAAEVAKMDALTAAIQALCLSKIIHEQQWLNFNEEEAFPYSPPANHFAQNILKGILTMRDAVTGIEFNKPIYGIDLAQFTDRDALGNWALPLGAGAGATLKTTVEAYVRHPDTGNAVILERCVHADER